MDDASYGSMYFDGRYKLNVYHNHNLGELYDLDADPGEFDNLWEDRNYLELKADLLKRSFDSAMMATDQYCQRIGPM